MLNFGLKLKYLDNIFAYDGGLAVAIFLLVMTIIILAWYIVIKNKKYVVSDNSSNNNSNQLSINNINPFSSGLQKPGLHQVASFTTDTTADPGNPANFQALECADGLVAISNIIDGANVCLADFDSACLTLSDCRPEAVACINNKCSLLSNINQACSSEEDCTFYNNQRVNNYTCVKEFGGVTGYCKVKNFPLGAGCNYDSDCDSSGLFNNVFCLKLENKSFVENFQASLLTFTITISNNVYYFTNSETGVNHNFWTLSTQIVFFDETDKTKITDDYIANGIEFGNVFYTGIISGTTNDSFSVINLNSTELPTGAKNITDFTPASNGSQVLVSFGGFPTTDNSIVAGYVGVCTEKLPLGAPSDVQIGDFTIPCEDQLVSNQGRCVQPNWSGKIGQVCLNLEDGNTSLTCNDNTLNLPIGCSYDYLITDNALNSFLYNYNPVDYNIYQLGVCSIEIRDIANSCTVPTYGCSRPYICLPTLDDSKNVNTVCLQPLDIMYCSQGSICPTDYTCKNITSSLGVQVPLCIGKTNAICYTSSDCLNSNCDANNLYLSMYSTDLNKYINLVTLSGINYNSLDLINIKLSKSYSTVTDFNGILGGQTKMPSSILYLISEDNSTIFNFFDLNTTTNNYDNGKTGVIQTNDAIDTQFEYTPDGNLAVFSAYNNTAVPEFGYVLKGYDVSGDYLVLTVFGYNIFNANSGAIYHGYIYGDLFQLSQQDNYTFTFAPDTVSTLVDGRLVFNCTTDILSANAGFYLPLFTNNINFSVDVNQFFLMISMYKSSLSSTQLFTYRVPSTITDNLFHIPTVYKFNSNSVYYRDLVPVPLFNTGDQITDANNNNYYLEELFIDPNTGNNYLFNLHSNYYATEGDVMTRFSSGTCIKVFNVINSGIDFANMNFNYNINTKAYTMNIIDISLLGNNGNNIIIPNQSNQAMNVASINGINRSISYVFDNSIDINISIESNNNIDYIYFKQDIIQKNNTSLDNITNTYIQKIKYTTSDTFSYSEAYDNVYFNSYTLNGTTYTNYYPYKYLNSFAIPRTKTTPQTGTFVSSFEETFFDNQTDTIQFLNTFKNNGSDTNAQVAAFSRFNEKNFVQSSGDIGTSYSNYNLFSDQQFQPYIINSNISLDINSDNNRVSADGTQIIFTDQDVIETILSFPSSEIVLSNNGSTLQNFFINGAGTSTVLYALQKEFTNINFEGIADIDEFTSKNTELVRTITVDSYDEDEESLTVNLNAPIDITNSYIIDIFTNGTKPKLWLHNFVPLTYLTGIEHWLSGINENNGGTIDLDIGKADGEYNNFTILDSSIIFGATKSADYNYTNNLTRTSYNKLVYYDGSEYNGYLVRDNYFEYILGGFDIGEEISISQEYNSSLSNRIYETIFSNSLSNYTQGTQTTYDVDANANVSITNSNGFGSTEVKGDFSYTDNSFPSLSNVYSLNASNNPFSSMLTIGDYLNGTNFLDASITVPAFQTNIGKLNIIIGSPEIEKYNYLNNNIYNLSTGVTGNYYSINSSRIFYNSGLLNNINDNGTVLPNQIKIFEINASINYSSSYGVNVNSDVLNALNYMNNTNTGTNIALYSPRGPIYSQFNNNGKSNNTSFCYFKRKYLKPRLFDHALALTSYGQDRDIIEKFNVPEYEIFPIGNNESSTNFLRDSIEYPNFDVDTAGGLKSVYISNGSYDFTNLDSTYIKPNTANIEVYNKQPRESFAIASKTIIPEFTLENYNPVSFMWAGTDFIKGTPSFQFGIVNKTYVDKYDFLMMVKYELQNNVDQASWKSSYITDTNVLNVYGTANVIPYLNVNYDNGLTSNAGVVIYLEIRPIYSATINIPINSQMLNNKNSQLYAINNMFLTSIERPLNNISNVKNVFKFNNRNLALNVFILNSFTYAEKTYYRYVGQINFPINTSPTIIAANSNYNLSNSEILNFPNHFTERFVSSDINNFVIDEIFTSYKFGNDFSKLRYYVYGHYLDAENSNTSNYQLLFLSTSSEKMLISKDRGVPASISFLQNKRNNLNVMYEPFNNMVIVLSSKCL